MSVQCNNSVKSYSRPVIFLRRALLALVFLPSLITAEVQKLSPLSSEQSTVHAYSEEKQLITVLQHIQAGQLTPARLLLQQLVQENPNFKLARLIQADLLSARHSALTRVGSVRETAQVQALLDELQKRWTHYQFHTAKELPRYLLALDDTQHHVIVVDAADSRLYLYQHQRDQVILVDDFYISIGLKGTHKRQQGDQRTPIGVYFVNQYIPPDELPDLYGAGAFPINYPNEWDRRLGNTGYGIWLHGTPSYTYTRPPRASDGCVTLSNKDFRRLSSYVDVGQTPVIIADGIEWSHPQRLQVQREQFNRLLEQWRQDWESRNIERFLANYSPDFNSAGKDYQAWSENARLAYADTNNIQIRLSNVSMLAYPQGKMVVTTFHQQYQSENILMKTVKRQYWQQDGNGHWKIIYEGSV